jgi:DNA mismatch repair protein MutS
MEIKDLNITRDIINLFDYTQNDDAKECLKKMLLTPLPSPDAVRERQEILKGFLANNRLFQNYSYSRIDFRETDYFIERFSDNEYLPAQINLKLKLYKALYHEYRSKFVQVVLLLNRLHNYIKNVPTTAFPDNYKKELVAMDDYLSSYRLNYYEGLVREGKLRIKHIIEFFRLISEKKSKKLEIAFKDSYIRFEAYISIANGIQANKFTFPEVSGNSLSISDFYHPVLKNPIKNTLHSKRNVILLTGPNMSGKSTLLKAIGICVYLANIGFAIPASVATIPFYSNIDVFINLNDDLQSGYSHFMTEIINLKKVIQEAGTGQRGFAVFDELFRGTNIDDALEISRSTLKGMLNFPESLFFVSSHLHRLTQLEEIKSGRISCMYLDCNLENDTPEFTYQLKEGTSDIKIGRILFEKENMNQLLKLE